MWVLGRAEAWRDEPRVARYLTDAGGESPTGWEEPHAPGGTSWGGKRGEEPWGRRGGMVSGPAALGQGGPSRAGAGAGRKELQVVKNLPCKWEGEPCGWENHTGVRAVRGGALRGDSRAG